MKHFFHQVLLLALLIPGTAWSAAKLPAYEKLRFQARAQALQGNFQQALPHASQALAKAESALGESHPALLRYHLDLALLQRILGEYARAEDTLLWAQGLAARHGSIDQKKAVQKNLAGLYVDMGRDDEALFIFKNGDDKLPLIQQLFRMGKAAEALDLLEKVIKTKANADASLLSLKFQIQ